MKKLANKTVKEVLVALAYGSVVSAFLCLMLFTTGCTTDSTTTSSVDISGIYAVTDGFQTIRDNQGTDKTTEFNLNDGLQVSVSQAGSAVKILNCLGSLQSNLTIESTYPFAQFYMGIEGCETVTCFAEFNGNTAYLYIHTDVMYSMLGFMGTSDVELELLLDRTLDETDCVHEVNLEESSGS